MSDKAIHKTLKPAQATLLRCFANAGKPITFEAIEEMLVTSNKVGLFGALGGLYTRGIVTHVGGPVPTISTDKVPRADFSRNATVFEMAPGTIALSKLLGLGA
jgi:hypothetical protein